MNDVHPRYRSGAAPPTKKPRWPMRSRTVQTDEIAASALKPAEGCLAAEIVFPRAKAGCAPSAQARPATRSRTLSCLSAWRRDLGGGLACRAGARDQPGRFVVHGAHGCSRARRRRMRMDRGRIALGTGHHQHPAAVLLRFRAAAEAATAAVLIVGTGTGILAITAARQPVRVTASDIDKAGDGSASKSPRRAGAQRRSGW